MTYRRLLVETQDKVVRITLNRPETRNAFDETLISELANAFETTASERSARVIVLQGSGPAFCAGADLDWMRRTALYSREENIADAMALQRMFAAIADCPCATVASVRGPAMGGGVGLLAACDVAVAAEDARMAFSEVRLGLIPAVVAPYVIQKIGAGAARALFVTGEPFDAATALRIGLVQQVVPGPELDSAVQHKVECVLKAGPEAVSAAKTLLRDLAPVCAKGAAKSTAERIAAIRASSEAQEGIQAFLEKRRPEFAG